MPEVSKLVITYHRYIVCLLGFVLSCFSLGRFNIPIFILFWPFCYLYFMHHEPKKYISIPCVIIFLLFANMVRYRYQESYLDQGFKEDMRSIAAWWPEQFIPFLIDGLFYGVIPKWKSVILFPMTVAAFEFCFSFLKRANNNIYAHSQFDNLVLAQMISLFGLFSLSFFLALFSSLLDYLIDFWRKNERKIHFSAFIYLGVTVFFYIYGGIYILCTPENDKIKVALTPGCENVEYSNTLDTPLEHLMPEYVLGYIEEQLIKAKALDCELLSFAEEAIPVYYFQREAVLEGVKALAKKYKMMISMPGDIYEVDPKEESWNGHFFFSEKGELLDEYLKHNIVPFMESEYETSNEKIKTFETTYGTFAAVICWDLNFAPFLNYIAFKHPDIVFGPSWDFYGIYNFQPQVTKFRAIENGFNIIKNTIDGIVVIYDFLGRPMIYYPGKQGKDYFLTAHVFKHGRKTLFSYLGIFWNWLYILGIFLIILIKPSFDFKNIITLKVDETGTSVYPTSDKPEQDNENVKISNIC